MTLSYQNSIYTRKKGEGTLAFTITSWTKGPNEPLDGTFASLKLFADDGKEVPAGAWAVNEDKNAKSNKQLQQSEPIEMKLPGGPLQRLQLTICKKPDGPFLAGWRAPTELAKVDLWIAELMRNMRVPQLVARHHNKTEKVENNFEFLIKISCSAKFDPAHATQAEREEWARNAKRGAGADR